LGLRPGRNRCFGTFDGSFGFGSRGLGRQGLDLVEIQRDLAAVDRLGFDLTFVKQPEQCADDQEMQEEREEKRKR